MGISEVYRGCAGTVRNSHYRGQRFLYFSGIGGVGYAVGRWQPAAAGSAPTLTARFRAWTEGLRRKIGTRIGEVVPGDDGNVAGALVNGEQSAIPQALQEAYRASGVAHLLSISGVHMSLLAGVVFFVMRRLLALVPAIAVRADTKKVAALTGLGATAFYVLISGMSVPAVRSFLMIAVVMLAILLDRTALSLRTIAWAALVLMILFPDAVVGASFQMSFLAVLSLVALYEQAWLRVSWRDGEGRLAVMRALGFYFMALVATDIAAGGSTALFAAYHFNRLPTYSIVTNFFAVPLTGLWIMPAGIIALLLMPLGLDEVPLQVMGAGVGVLNDLARTIAAWPAAQVQVPPMEAWAMALGALGIVFVCIWRGQARWLGFALLLPAFIQPHIGKAPDLLVDETARVFAVSDAKGQLVLKPGRAGRFVRGVWVDRYGESTVEWPGPGHADDDLALACDADGCVLERGERKVLLAFNPSALAEDCGMADLIISVTASRDICRRGRIIDGIDLRRDGAYAVWLTGAGIKIRSVRDATGNRAWMRGAPQALSSAGEDPPDDLEP